jgi:ABC-type nitrate/sulfonate/bicarbonate transport system substrate-binding protein
LKKLVLTIILSCLSFLNASNLQKTSVQLIWFDQFQFAGFYTAIEKGFYKEAGLDVELKKYNNSNVLEEFIIKAYELFILFTFLLFC